MAINTNNIVNAINAVSNEDIKAMFDALYGKSTQAVNNVVEVVEETVVTSENKMIVNKVKEHAIDACKKSYAAGKEGVVISVMSTAVASVYSTKKVAEGATKLADVTSKQSKKFASWILAQ